MLNSFYFILGRAVAACFEINCSNVLGFACKGSAILEINKQMMKTDNIQKLVRTNYVTNLYKNWDFRGQTRIFFLFFFLRVQKQQEFRGRRHRTCWRKSHRSHNQNVVIK